MRGTRRAAALAVAALAVVGCSSDDGSLTATGDGATTTTTTTTTKRAPRSTSTTAATTTTADLPNPNAADAAELEAFAPDEVPAGFERQPDDAGDTGPSDLAKAVADEGGDASTRAALVAFGFRRGYQWLYSDEAEDEVVVFLYEFEAASGATGNARRVTDLLGELGPPAPSAVAEGAQEWAATQDGVGSAVVLATTGPYMVLVRAFAQADQGGDVTIGRARAAAASTLAGLPR